jgi:hypothetical protein
MLKIIEKNKCLGCSALENPNFTSNKDCIYARIQKAKESIEQIKINLEKER